MMIMATKRSIFGAHLAEWLATAGDREKRGKMIKDISRIAKVHPKSVSRSFRRIQMEDKSSPERRGRSVYYTKDVDTALYDVWDAANRPCGELLHPMIDEYVTILSRDKMWREGDETTKKLLTMSEGTVKRRVSGLQKRYGVSRGRSTTRPSALKSVIPIFKGPWENLPPGTGQLDTVAHCGSSIAGDYVYTVNYTDTALYWGVRKAQWNKGQEATVESMTEIKRQLPFPWKMGHPDTGSEFINWLAKAWFESEDIKLTRSEPGKKNDNMYVEERNGHVVRKYLGWQRIDCFDTVSVLNELYEILDLYLNHFQAVRRTLKKERVGARYIRVFEKRAKTPYQRLMEHRGVSRDVKGRMQREHESLNPLRLKKRIDTLLKSVFRVQKQGYGAE
jgi:hypothetical protein